MMFLCHCHAYEKSREQSKNICLKECHQKFEAIHENDK
jgi:hypothetical protein